MKFRVRMKFGMAKMLDPWWWVEKEDLRFHNIIGLQWVRLIKVPEGGAQAGSVAFFLGPLFVKLFIGWAPRGQKEGEA